MAYQQHVSNTRSGGPVRNSQHGTGTNLATYDTTSSSANRVNTMHSARSSVESEQRDNGSQHIYPQQLADSDIYSYDYSYISRHSETGKEHIHYIEVPRAWWSLNRGALQALPIHQDHNQTTYERIYTYTKHSHQSYFHARPQDHLPTEEVHSLNRFSHQHLGDRRKLSMSNLRDLNQSRVPIYAMDRRLYETQRAGPYDGIQYVGRRSDYERFRDQG
ncbi:hypothetical protein BDU57DRAFT_86203 [Ampelomyces quisqualis]|uniref:Uncharacterized protein n=1 Tax=Ampelomyces quisqualis TaxID=50730 RepID=A0A6A5QAC1_AMPQU|nr:hypothetical protein BDU57DRAFT_86203 [Ampelomyces quisqualis]